MNNDEPAVISYSRASDTGQSKNGGHYIDSIMPYLIIMTWTSNKMNQGHFSIW